jgi:3-hydroxybutyryl-CoA dehydrogenase
MIVLVIGAGTMGAGIAETLIVHGHRAIVTDPDEASRGRAEDLIKQNLHRAIERGRLEGPFASVWQRLSIVDSRPDMAVDWVIEAAPEQVTLKQRLFAELDQVYPSSVWLASNTSSIAIGRLKVNAVRHPERIGGLHFFNPVPRMALVEIILGRDTDPSYDSAAKALVASLGKTGISVPDRPGFLVNRVARPYYLEGLRLVDDGVASPETVDAVMEGAGFPMGPFRVMDLVGLDVNLAVTQSVFEQTYYDERYRPDAFQHELVERRWLGRKTGRGFYRYE